jgi:hypothetical protein
VIFGFQIPFKFEGGINTSPCPRRGQRYLMANSPHTPARPPSTSTPSQWIFTKAEILSSPSIKEGMDPQLEATNRSKGANFIDMVGHKLRLHQITIATATMFFHRFYMFRSLSRFHHYVLPSLSHRLWYRRLTVWFRRSERRVCFLRLKLRRIHESCQT